MKMNIYMNYVSLIMVTALVSCGNGTESKDLILDETEEVYELYDYYVDEKGNEGIVGYIHPKKGYDYKYVIVLSADESLLPWGPMDEVVYKQDSISSLERTSVTFGLAMCQAMFTIGIQRYPAQEWCFNKNEDKRIVYSGCWRLPSYYELYLIFGGGGKLIGLNTALSRAGATTLDKSHYYWTCTEDIDNYITLGAAEYGYDQANRAALISPQFYSFSYKDHWLKKNRYYVRAIKYIYYLN